MDRGTLIILGPERQPPEQKPPEEPGNAGKVGDEACLNPDIALAIPATHPVGELSGELPAPTIR